jgi:exodeoxyribonuclease VII large subunit
MENNQLQLSVSEFVTLTNQTLDFAFPTVSVVGEVTEFRVSQGKWVSFKLKDADAVVGCFLVLSQLRQPIQDGMKLLVVANPRLNNKGFFSLNVRAMKPVGEGSIKKGFDLLKAKLEAEGLFSPERKRTLPRVPQRVAVVTSTESAGYADFCKIINERWGGLSVEVAHTQVQGVPAPDQMIRAIRYFNSLDVLPEVLVIIRGGGSAEDLMAFNDEPLARAIAESRIPTLVGVGHEVDHTLADMIADVRAATPTNAAEILVPDRNEIIRAAHQRAASLGHQLTQAIDEYSQRTHQQLEAAYRRMQEKLDENFERLAALRLATAQLNPENILRRGYAFLRGEVTEGSTIEIETTNIIAQAEVKHVRTK